ncbi:MAG TPA: hypothetical protein VIX73_32800, partial [Kofleriaceae bacterium]
KGPAQLPLRRTTLRAGEIAAAAADRLRARHPERPLEVSAGDDVPAIHVDPVLFRRVIDNLLENAHKYTPDTAAPIALGVARDDAGHPRYVTSSSQLSSTWRMSDGVALHTIVEADHDATHALQYRVIGVFDLAFTPEP